MQAIDMPDARSRIEAIRGRLTRLDLPDIESLPDMKDVGRDVGRMSKEVGRKSVELVNQVTGRQRRSPWRWVAVGLGLLATTVIVAVVAMAATGRWTTDRMDIRRRIGTKPEVSDGPATRPSSSGDAAMEPGKIASNGDIG